MSKARKRKPVRKRIGKVSVYQHHGAWYVYYRDEEKTVRRKVADDQGNAESIAAQINAQLSTGARTLLAFEPISVADLRQAFLDDHEHVVRSSIQTVRRYEAATQHIVDYDKQAPGPSEAHEVNAAGFATYLRTIEVAPNGHKNSQRRLLRDKGVLYILQTCRSIYAFAAKKRHLPPYSENPFSNLSLSRFHIDDSKVVAVFDLHR